MVIIMVNHGAVIRRGEPLRSPRWTVCSALSLVVAIGIHDGDHDGDARDYCIGSL